ncbi:condensation domain-containing protein [Micromonospora tarapacensis]|uniref:condensation domain-containing protein n=1 Tax=Micromonospora tarapacensis TaxID=2835305 RepID=UPI001E336A2E|nr:condensation domain-containing protein [Micromonospora tarapacensis]
MSQSSAGDLLAELESAGVRVWLEAGQLRFRAPQGAMTPTRREALRARRDEIVAHLDNGGGVALVPDPARRHDPFPVTDVQAAYLLGRGETFAYGGVACHGYGELIYPALDPARMTAAWRALIERHDMLRAVVEADGAQRVLPQVPPFEVPVIDLTGRPDAVVEAGLSAVRAEMDHLVHAPDRWPLFAARITLADDRAVLHMSIDFLIADFISVQVVLDELHRLYHRPDEPLPPLEITFRDYQLAERAVRDSPRHARDRQWWLDRVDDLPAAPELPTVSRPADSEGRFRRWETRLSPQVWEGCASAPAGTASARPARCWPRSPTRSRRGAAGAGSPWTSRCSTGHRCTSRSTRWSATSPRWICWRWTPIRPAASTSGPATCRRSCGRTWTTGRSAASR